MNYNHPNREITIGVRRELTMPDDAGSFIQIVTGKRQVSFINTWRSFDAFKERDDLMKTLIGCGQIVYQQDVVAFTPSDKHLEDSLICYLVELRNQFEQQKDVVQAGRITEKLRSMGVVLMDRKDSAMFWNVGGEKK